MDEGISIKKQQKQALMAIKNQKLVHASSPVTMPKNNIQ